MIFGCYGNREKKKENVKLGKTKQTCTSEQIIKNSFPPALAQTFVLPDLSIFYEMERKDWLLR